MPSPRDIPIVKRHWPSLPHDKLIEKYKTQVEAYADAQKFFKEHKEYTHLAVCPDDLEITPDLLEILWEDTKKYSVISGYCNLQEDQPTIFNIQFMEPLQNTIHPPKAKGNWVEEEHLSKLDDYFTVGHAGFGCTIMDRDSFNHANFTSTILPDGGTHGGNFDYKFCQDMAKHHIPIYVNKKCRFYHWRLLQYHEIINENGYELFIKSF